MRALGLLLRLIAVFLVVAGSGGHLTASDLPPGSEKSPQAAQEGTAKPADRGSSSKLFEAVSGYLEGFHRKPPQDRSKVRATDRFDPASVKASDPAEDGRKATLASELARAEELIQRGEWDLAVRSLERALEASSLMESGADTGKLKQLLAQARNNASDGVAGKTVTPGEITNSLAMKMVLIPAGTFTMGSSAAEVRDLENEWNAQREIFQPEEPAHSVKISRAFLLGKYDVTVAQFKRFIEETGYTTVAEKQGWGWAYDDKLKHWTKRSGASWRNTGAKLWDDHPVTFVCYRDAEAFCKWLGAKDGRTYHLPTEAQWEYAARGAIDGERYPWGNEHPDGKKANLADRRSPVPWADRTLDDGSAGPSPVGSYAPNGYWLYDMAGNVWQLCSDYYGAKAYENTESRTTVDPTGPKSGQTRVVRGGNWAFGAGIARNAFRFGVAQDMAADFMGFRVAAIASPGDLTAEQTSQEKRPQGNSSLAPDVDELLDEVKKLASSGRRTAARRAVEKFRASAVKAGTFRGEPLDAVAKAAESLIDLSEDKTRVSFTNSLGMKLIRVPSGSFVMGSSDIDIAWAMATLAQEQPVQLENELPFHKVRISRPFFIGATEVTVGQFKKFVDETGYVTDAEDAGGGQVFNEKDSRFEVKDGATWKNPGWPIEDEQPVAMLSWNDAQAFCEWLSAKEKLPYKLPTEAQWEYAARGGLPMSHFPWGDNLPDGRKANYADKSTSYTWRDRYADDGYKFVAPVGSYEPNGYGLYDMAGNVLEWVRDHYGEDYYKFSPEIDPEGPGHGENRVMKGGEWTFGPVNLRCAFRGWARPEMAFFNGGFRVAIDLSSSRKTFHFANNFLTKEWIPGQDEREVAGAVAKDKERRDKLALAGTKSGPESRSAKTSPVVLRGVKVLDFTPKSDARKAGLAKGDVILQYDGVGDLTSDKLIGLTANSKKQRTKPELVFVRDGYEYSIHVDPGFLGATLVDTRVEGPFRKPEPVRRPADTEKGKKDGKKPLDWT